jgi:hypothetical protein
VRSPAEYSSAPLDDEQPTRAAVGPVQGVVAARVVVAVEPPASSLSSALISSLTIVGFLPVIGEPFRAQGGPSI